MERKKVVWSEGMFLRPHHFQQLERHLEHRSHIHTECAAGLYWGYKSLVLDHDALSLGKLALKQATGVFPDGTPFDFSAQEDAPPALDIPAGAHRKKIVLAMPRKRRGGQDVSFDGDDDRLARYQAVEHEVADSTAVALGPAVLQLGQLRLRLMLEDEADGEWLTLGVAVVLERLNDNRLLLDSSYIPPTLACGMNMVLRTYIHELYGLLEARSELLVQRLVEPGRGGVSEVSEFLLLKTINRYRGALWHAQQLETLHPERLFHDLLMLAGELSTFSDEGRRLVSFPVYRHDDLALSFEPLMQLLRRFLSAMLEDKAIQIPLEDKGQGVRVAHLSDPEMVRTAGLVLAVHAQMPSELTRARLPAQAKLGPIERIRDLVHLQLPGITLRPLANVPKPLPYHAGYIYFELEKSGEMWKQFERTGGLALHLAGDFPGLQLEFWAIRE
ncbi:type VI secretion system baseplate subunit TssK [Pusillimonas sp. MFBS29]|uniref:type VI secretion system baseplate subunit TssK n=1 Tax=Pusillimonas sp. MFBS29 TaxID=2886690 RepID=UPI001D12D959|nr:type VI secretion system baseplate subunit TssK [Pusillimonas sp. MFBS29]MCC2596540.1 type VI secretion system baseplate subunit TssK [Pusillimonas sp. MFBS29]